MFQLDRLQYRTIRVRKHRKHVTLGNVSPTPTKCDPNAPRSEAIVDNIFILASNTQTRPQTTVHAEATSQIQSYISGITRRITDSLTSSNIKTPSIANAHFAHNNNHNNSTPQCKQLDLSENAEPYSGQHPLIQAHPRGSAGRSPTNSSPLTGNSIRRAPRKSNPLPVLQASLRYAKPNN